MTVLRILGFLFLMTTVATPATALTQGSSTVSNCGGEAGNWIDVTFTTTDGVRLVDVWWDFNGSVVWLDQDGTSLCTPQNTGVTTVDPYFDHDPPVDTQDWGCAFTGFDGGEYVRLKMDLDRGGGGTPFSEDFYGGTVTVEFSDGSTATGTFDTDYDWPNGCTANFTVLAPSLPNFAFMPRPGWDAPFVPRASSDATSNNVPAPLLLPGDLTATWLNTTFQNAGTAASGRPTLTIHCDGELMHTIEYLFGMAPGAFFGPINLGPEHFKSGRHTMRATVDPLDTVTESNESDNVHAAQYSWAAGTLTYNSPETRTAPPHASADLALVPGGTTDENCDGIRIVKDGAPPGDQSDWMVVWSQRLAHAGDSYFMRLFDATNDPETAFTGPIATTQAGQGLEAFIINTRNSAATLYDVGIYNPDDDTVDHQVDATFEGSTNLARGSQMPFTGDRLRLVEFFSAIGHLGPATLTIATDPAQGPVEFGWLPMNHAIGNLGDLQDLVTTDANGFAKILVDLSLIGYNAAVFYQDGASAPLSATLGYLGALPDLEPYQPAGWAGTVIPRPTDDASVGSCDLPSILYGDVASTYMNASIWNTGNALADTVGIGFAFDGRISVWTRNVARVLDHGDPYIITNMMRMGVPFTIPSGRHTVTTMADYADDLGESIEANNWTGTQFCWTPPELTYGTPVSRDAPPDRTGGHPECDPGQTLYPNCDGVRLGASSSTWRGLAVMPPSSVVDLGVELHEPLTDSQNGFGPRRIAESAAGDGQIDFVLVNDRSAPATPYDVGILDDPDFSFTSYSAEPVEASVHTTKPLGQTVRYDIGPGYMMDLHEYYFLTGPMLISLTDDGSGVDWGVSIYGGADFFGKGDHLLNGMSFAAGPGETEHVLVDIPSAGHYCIAVWKADQSQMSLSGSYRLNFAPGVTGTDEPAPMPFDVTRLLNATPNPFNPQTTVHFALVEPGFCRLTIHDLQGRLVRSLVLEPRPAGRNAAIWDGRDDGGRTVASGVYLARLEAGSSIDRMKLTLVK